MLTPQNKEKVIDILIKLISTKLAILNIIIEVDDEEEIEKLVYNILNKYEGTNSGNK